MKCLTYQEFLVELYSTWDHTILRKGQYLMNLLHKHWPEEYARVTALNVEGKQVDWPPDIERILDEEKAIDSIPKFIVEKNIS